MRKITINVLWPFIAGLAIWLGVTGRVDWWVIILIAASQISLNYSFHVGF